ncbi:MAG: hypothetical protein QGE95_11460 [Arenicellales bacterium]|nr:hypothetical protein [Arenicellales bacterium]
MSRSAENAASFMDAVIALVGLALVGVAAWNFYRIQSLPAAIELNKAHLCWTMETMFGAPDGGQTREEACDVLREQIQEYWNR